MIPEAPRVLLRQVSASDPDEPEGRGLSYHLYDDALSDALAVFSISPSSGELTIRGNLRGKEHEVYQFFVQCSDGKHQSRVAVSVLVLGAEEKAPRCPKSHAQYFLREDAALGTVIMSLWSSGPMDIEYDIVSGGVTPEGLVQFSVQGGQLILAAPLDHEAMPQHRIVLANATRRTTPRLVVSLI